MKPYKFIAACIAAATVFSLAAPVGAKSDNIKWIDFTVSEAAMSDALKFCEKRYQEGSETCYTDVLAFVAARHGGNFAAYKRSDLDDCAKALDAGDSLDEACGNKKLFSYYSRAYAAVLGGMVGRYTEYTDESAAEKYGLTAFSPIADGYSFSHYDDFGAARSFGYKRNHLGHDLMGSVGTPIIAVEGGYVEACGWNMYGGWRIGIRSLDGKRYYYYAHLRRGHPYCDMYEGKQVYAGEVIGYLGMTGYSSRPDTNNINVPHLHYGLQIIFTPEQKDGNNQIWIDMYALTSFLQKNRAGVEKTDDGEYRSKRCIVPMGFQD